MSDSSSAQHQAPQRVPPEHEVKSAPPGLGPRLGRVAGVDIHLDWSLAIIFMLVTFSLATGVLPRWHPGWGAVLTWGVAIAAATLFFVSVLVHEMSHALVGRAYGMQVQRITLFVFGGMAHLEGEPSRPKAELLMAIVGPVTSIAIGIFATVAGTLLAGGVTTSGDPEEIARSVGPVATLLLWLGPINLILGVFNLVPGFPLDGGRVLRAILWWSTGDVERATRWAAGVGRGFGWLLMGTGVLMALGTRVPFFGRGLVGGVWLVLIGWFLQNAARASYAQLMIRRRLTGVPVTHLMRSQLYTVRPDTTLAELVRDYIMNTDQSSFPVVEGDVLVGIVSSKHLRNVPNERWSSTVVRQVMAPAGSGETVDARADANDALQKLVTSDAEQLPVLDHGHLQGFVRRQDILKWLALQADAPA